MSGKTENQPSSDIEGFDRLVDALFEETAVKVHAILEDAEKSAEAVMSESKKYSIKRCREIIDFYNETSEVESRKLISKAEIDSRMQVLRAKEAILERVFEDAREELAKFTASDEYLESIRLQITKLSKEIALGMVAMNANDLERIGEHALKKILGSNVEIKAQNVGTGGFVLVSKDGKVVVDRTLDSILRSKKEAMRGKIAEKLFG